MKAGIKQHEQLQNQWKVLAEALRELPVNRLGIIGGDTCQSILGQLNIRELEPESQLQPGLPVSGMELDGRNVMLMTKSGGLGDEYAIVQMTE